MSSFVAVAVGSFITALLLGLTVPVYPVPFDYFRFLLLGSSALHSTYTYLLIPSLAIFCFISWIVIGVIIGPFSKTGWNTVRSAVWVGLFIGVFSLTSTLLTDVFFWDVATNPDRNIDLFYLFTTTLITSQLSLISGIPSAKLVQNIREQADPPIPSKIESVCECGAVFKSIPILCSECGRRLSD